MTAPLPLPAPGPGPTDNVRGAAWMVFSALAFAAMDAIVKVLANQGMPATEIVFFRALFGAIVLAPFVFGGPLGVAVLKTRRPWLHLGRVMAGTAAMMSIFAAVANMSLATATAIAYARPLFLVILAVIFLGEVVRWRRWSATAIGFIGVLLILRPGPEGLNLYALVALAAALFMAIAMVFIKKLSSTERPLTMLAWFTIASIPVSGIPAAFVWQAPTWEQMGLAVLMGVLGSLGQYGVIRAFRVGEASAVVPFDYSHIPMAWAWGFFLFGEQPTVWTWVGTAVVIGSNLYIVHRESRKGR